MCVYLYIHNTYTQHTHIYIILTQTFILDAINYLTALICIYIYIYIYRLKIKTPIVEVCIGIAFTRPGLPSPHFFCMILLHLHCCHGFFFCPWFKAPPPPPHTHTRTQNDGGWKNCGKICYRAGFVFPDLATLMWCITRTME